MKLEAEGAIVKTCPDGYGTIKTEQAEQEPVAWVEVERGIPMFMDFADDYKPNINNGIAPLYAAPVRTKDLTDEEITNEWESMGRGLGKYTEFARAVIAADREKNGSR